MGGRGWNSLTNYDSVFAVFRAQSSESKKPYLQIKGFSQQNLRKKHTHQESKNKEVIKGIPERDLKNC